MTKLEKLLKKHHEFMENSEEDIVFGILHEDEEREHYPVELYKSAFWMYLTEDEIEQLIDIIETGLERAFEKEEDDDED